MSGYHYNYNIYGPVVIDRAGDLTALLWPGGAFDVYQLPDTELTIHPSMYRYWSDSPRLFVGTTHRRVYL